MSNNNQNLNLAWHITPGAATLSFEGNILTFTSDQVEYNQVKELLRNNDQDGIIELMRNYRRKSAPVNESYVVKDDVVYVQDEALPRVLGERIVEFSREKLPIQPLLNFWNRLKNNPSYRAVQRLFECLEFNHHCILPDGRLLGWKKVRNDFKDIYSGTFDNTPGNVVKMPRNQVDEDPNHACMSGLHVASWKYARYHYGVSPSNKLVECAVDPKDVVAIPYDYKSQKFRVCEYEVLRECTEEDKSKIYGYNPEDEDDEDWEDDNICPDCEEDYDYCECEQDDEDY